MSTNIFSEINQKNNKSLGLLLEEVTVIYLDLNPSHYNEKEKNFIGSSSEELDLASAAKSILSLKRV